MHPALVHATWSAHVIFLDLRILIILVRSESYEAYNIEAEAWFYVHSKDYYA
jgi:hypothetical protein